MRSGVRGQGSEVITWHEVRGTSTDQWDTAEQVGLLVERVGRLLGGLLLTLHPIRNLLGHGRFWGDTGTHLHSCLIGKHGYTLTPPPYRETWTHTYTPALWETWTHTYTPALWGNMDTHLHPRLIGKHGHTLTPPPYRETWIHTYTPALWENMDTHLHPRLIGKHGYTLTPPPYGKTWIHTYTPAL